MKEKESSVNKTNNLTREISSFSKMEEDVLKFWQKNKTFDQSVKREAPRGDYAFYDGPPFATGLPHYGHLVASVMKDAVPRYWTMRGYRVERRWGWDCHGLPIENLAEKEMEIKDKQDIEKLGVGKFNEYCKSIVLRYADEWKKTINRVGRWVDMENDYKTMNSGYMESIWWIFKKLWEKKLIYKGYKSMHICTRCGTTLSNFEVGLGYKNVKDLSVIAKFELLDEPGTYFLAWTTTPWTLIGNVALAIGEELDYLVVEIEKERYILAKEKAEEVLKDKKYKIKKELKGRDLIGKKYKPLFDYYFNDEELENRNKGWEVYAGDFVSTEEGTGIVHIAPAFGENDMNIQIEHGLPFVQHVDIFGKIKNEAKDFAGMEVKPKNDYTATDVEIIKYLAHSNLLFAKEKYEHSYPHCWRCETPLLNYATESWFVKVVAIKKDLVANNEKVNWVPEHVKEGRFGKWLEQARDWSISRNRYWGAPLPVWECEKCNEIQVVGSKKELEELSGEKTDDLHKQFVDKISWDCRCGGKTKRVSEVLDCWFESGSMPYAQMHYMGKPLPDFDPEKEKNFPAEFVAEGMDQTRGWFYTLMILSTALFKKEAFKNVIVNGIVLAEDGQKMSKSKGNYPDPNFLFDKFGADALRQYLLSSPVLIGENFNFSEEGVSEALRKNVILLWNVTKFYDLFVKKNDFSINQENGKEPLSENVLDLWILSRLNELIKEVTKNLENYNLPSACQPISYFIGDLSTWYLRRSRSRFKNDNQKDLNDALETTGYVLLQLSKTIAPIMPFIAEQVWQKVTGNDFKEGNKSVHLENWASQGKINEKILLEMSETRKIVELGLARRDEKKIKVRQPLASLKIKNYQLEEEYFDLIKEELNIKNIEIEKSEGEIEVDFDFNITKDLEREGLKREAVRIINDIRKKKGLGIDDVVVLHYETESTDLREVFEGDNLGKNLLKEVLAKKAVEGMSRDVDGKEVEINGNKAVIGLKLT